MVMNWMDGWLFTDWVAELPQASVAWKENVYVLDTPGVVKPLIHNASPSNLHPTPSDETQSLLYVITGGEKLQASVAVS